MQNWIKNYAFFSLYNLLNKIIQQPKVMNLSRIIHNIWSIRLNNAEFFNLQRNFKTFCWVINLILYLLFVNYKVLCLYYFNARSWYYWKINNSYKSKNSDWWYQHLLILYLCFFNLMLSLLLNPKTHTDLFTLMNFILIFVFKLTFLFLIHIYKFRYLILLFMLLGFI